MSATGSWMPGGTVTVDYNGTPVEAIVVRSPYEGEDAWTDPWHDAWVVDVDGLSEDDAAPARFYVRGRKIVAEVGR